MPDEYEETIEGEEETEFSLELPELDEVDRNFLDIQYIETEKVYREWSLYMEDLRDGMEAWKASMDNTVANLDKEIREKNPAANETKLKKMIELQPEYVEAQRSHQEAQSLYRKVTTFLLTLDMRRRTLDALIKLYGMQYFALSSSPDHDAASKLVNDIRKNNKTK